MLASLGEVPKAAEQKKIAVGAFNITIRETASAVCAAAEKTKSAVTLEYAPVHSSFLSTDGVAEIMLYFARKAKVPTDRHLDHAPCFEMRIKAIELRLYNGNDRGFRSPYEDNMRETAAVVRAAHASNVAVKADLARISTSNIGANNTIGETFFTKNENLYTKFMTTNRNFTLTLSKKYEKRLPCRFCYNDIPGIAVKTMKKDAKEVVLIFSGR